MYQSVYIKYVYVILFVCGSLIDLKACGVCSACIPVCQDNHSTRVCLFVCGSLFDL